MDLHDGNLFLVKMKLREISKQIIEQNFDLNEKNGFSKINKKTFTESLVTTTPEPLTRHGIKVLFYNTKATMKALCMQYHMMIRMKKKRMVTLK